MEIKRLLTEIKYEKSYDEIKALISEMTNPVLLHMTAVNYNWDDGFDIPECIIQNKHCDLGTALMIFDFADGYSFLFDNEEITDTDWKNFIEKLKLEIQNGKFKTHKIKYLPELSRTGKLRIKKLYPDLDGVFLEGTSGKEIELIIV
ncbi:MAG: DUF4274 domain-containing protein [Ruminococcus flavefaciens]|nr:DUF4274 domain-containing protein [Ruminococcus flavefaciens]